jgi:hypothetical protein
LEVRRDLLPAGDEQEEFGVPGALVACAETPVFCAFVRNKLSFLRDLPDNKTAGENGANVLMLACCNQEGSTVAELKPGQSSLVCARTTSKVGLASRRAEAHTIPNLGTQNGINPALLMGVLLCYT